MLVISPNKVQPVHYTMKYSYKITNGVKKIKEKWTFEKKTNIVALVSIILFKERGLFRNKKCNLCHQN